MDLTYGTPKKLPDGRYYLKVSSGSENRVMVQLNKVKILTKFDESDDVTLELNQAAIEKISGIDAQNLSAAKTHCVEWFGKAMAEQTIDAAYSKSTQELTMNTTKARVGSQVVTKVFTHDRKALDVSEVAAGTECDVILEFSGIWFMRKTFGPIWRIAQVRLLAPPKKLYPDEYLFQDEDTPQEPEEADEDYI
jgi:hypothetical protein